MTRTPFHALLTCAAALALAGCAADQSGDAAKPSRTVPADLTTGETPDAQAHDDISKALRADDAREGADNAAPAEATPPIETGPSSPGGPGGAAPGEPGVQQASLDDRPSYVLDAMVGQVNGRPIYADTILDPIEPQLQALARQVGPGEFRQRATQLIEATVRQIVLDALILGEAERDLSDRERAGLQGMVLRHREELLRQYGQGSLSLTEHNLQQATGKSLEQTLEEYRQKVLVSRYLANNLRPKINVTRWDIERYYRDHQDEFNPKASRVLRLIRVQNDEEAQRVREMLQTRPFEEVALDKINLYKPAQGGLMDATQGTAVFDNDAMNQALAELGEGEWAGPFQLSGRPVFVFVEELTEAKSIPLKEAQPIIERRLRENQFRQLTDDYNRRLFEQGSFEPLPQMVDRLVQIALARYAGQG